ncbi:aminodeoxychorismate synthase component I [Paraglaciecola sp.]|uniref:aminodeoxychorismate synthase component I n=1 Tax=Paraglaciecola sp. TaxID=1920173 RepID=UPI00273D6464|nr:aminodeoxychorismate synthase component I [Paraglaciecola sp.]MDP5030570.1 aminodeoxychorismate synthase component I [Paraglaciecola sp.]
MLQTQVPKLAIYPLAIPSTVKLSTLFSAFSSQAWSVLLDSANSQHMDARFDIMVANPVATIINKQQQNTVWQKDHVSYQTNDNPLHLIQTLQQAYFNLIPTTDEQYAELPFLIGAVGYFGYDLSHCFENLPKQKITDYQAPDMAVGIYTWSVIKDRVNGLFYLCAADHYPHPEPLFFEQLVKNEGSKPSFKLTGDWQANMTSEFYKDQLQQVDEYLRAGDCYQINFAQRFNAHYEGDEWHAYLALTEANNAPFSAFIRLPECCILSISPERFLAVKNGHVETKPIKGTRPRSADPVIDQQSIDQLLSADKDRAENLMIVDLLRNDLSKHCKPHTVKVPKLFEIESFAAVHHLVSTVTGELANDSSIYALFQGAFPGGSITGAPKIRAMQIINKLEPNERNIYCGSIGYFGFREDMDTSICIRTLLCENGNIYCWAGGGIVLDSVPGDEYQESLDKVAKILPILASLE